jgi:hypothetical protein
VLSAEGLDDLQIQWASNYQLELTVPNHADIGTLLASYNGVDIGVHFVPPNPEERARWVDYKRQLAEWGDRLGEWDARRRTDPSHAGPPPEEPHWNPQPSGNQPQQ